MILLRLQVFRLNSSETHSIPGSVGVAIWTPMDMLFMVENLLLILVL